MKQQTPMQALWEWIDANCHEDGFNINDAREMSLKMEADQSKADCDVARMQGWNKGYEDGHDEGFSKGYEEAMYDSINK